MHGPSSSLLLVGLSHRTAPVEVRERYAIGPSDLPQCLRALVAIDGVREAFALSTCNRTEVLLLAEEGANPADAVVRTVFRNAEPPQLYVFHGVSSIMHVFRVAGGLDSLVMGESEILAQLKRALQAAVVAGTAGTILRALLEQALRVGKRVRTETELGQGTLSIARVGVELAERIFTNFDRRTALVVGAGETGVLTARHLKARGIGELHFANRTLERAQAAAAELGGQAHGMEALPALVSKADLVLVCIDGGAATLGTDAFDRKFLARRDRPLLVVDLSVPRAVDARVGAYENLLLYDLDDLDKVVEENKSGRERATDATSEILVGEVHKFLALRTFAAFTPAIERLRERIEEVREETVDRVCGATATPKEVQLAHELSRRLLDVALSQMKESARHTSSPEALDRLYHRFLEEL